MKQTIVFRIFFYVAALLILALGLILNSKSGLGVSAIISVAYCVSIIWGLNFGNITLVWYIIFVIAEMILHTIRNRRRAAEGDEALKHALKTDMKLTYVMDLLQIPLSIVFTRFMNLFSAIVPEPPENLFVRLIVLLLGITFTGIGAAMTLDMRIVPNPGDGIVQAIADFVRKPIGLTKNCVDLCAICLSILISLIFAGKIVAVGLGTVLAVIFVGRVIAIFNGMFMEKLMTLAGVDQ